MPVVLVAEGTSTSTVVYTATTPIPPGGSVSLIGSDAARFNVNASTGAVTFNAVPDFENPTDTGADNVYDVTLEVRDASSVLVGGPEALSVTVTDVAPTFASGSTASVPEGTSTLTVVYTAVATDPAGGTVVYSISGGADAAKFNINSATGAVKFNAVPDFENPTDVGANDVYDITVQATTVGGTLSGSKNVAITVTDVATTFSSGSTASVPEGTSTSTVVYTAVATDPGGGVVYSISGGADAAKFNIDSSTGAVTFITSPNFESPTDVGANDVYDITVQALAVGGAATAFKNVAITVTDVAPTITSAAAASVNEGIPAGSTVYTTVAADPAGGTVTYSLVAGGDAAAFSIDSSTGIVTINSTPDFETKSSYSITVKASDPSGFFNTQAVTINVTDLAPVISSGAAASVNEGMAPNTIVYTATAADPAGGTVTYSLTGIDAAAFSIDASTGVVTINASPDFETKTSYDFNVRASDPSGLFNTQAVTINVTDFAPVISSGSTASVNEGISAGTTVYTAIATDPAGGTVTYSFVAGGDAAAFSIDSSTGIVTINSTPDFETKSSYGFTVRASDPSGLFNDQVVTINVTDLAPVISSGATASVNEAVAPGTTVYTTVAADPAGGTVTYALVAGGDAAAFSINSSTGVVTINSTPDFETKPSYSFTVKASDASGVFNTQAVTINVNDLAPVISSGSTASVAEGTSTATTVYTAIAADPAGGTVTYSLVAGGDAARFNINSATGAVKFNAVPDFEAPLDTGANNSYDITVKASDPSGAFNTQAVTINVTNVNDAPVNTVPGAQVASEDTNLSITGVSVADADAAPQNVTTTLSVLHGILDVRTDVAGGVDASHVSGDTTGSVTLTGTTAQINATLGSANGLIYHGNFNYSGADTLTVLSNDLGHSGGGGAQSDSDTVGITVNAVTADTLSAFQSAALKTDVDGDGQVDPGDTVTVTVQIGNNSAATAATGVSFNETLSGLTQTGGVHVTPIAFDDSFTGVVGNSPIDLNVLGNDADPLGTPAALTIFSVDTTGTAGTVTINGDNTLRFTPTTGFQGTTTFKYVAHDAEGLNSNEAATVTVNVNGGLVWYVDSQADGGNDGSAGKAFTTLAEAAAASGANDTIFVTNRGATYAEAAGITLNNGEKLIGDGSTTFTTVNGIAVGASSSNATFQVTGNNTTDVTLNSAAAGNTIDGITLTATGTNGAGIAGTGFGTLNVSNVALSTTGTALSLTNGAFGASAAFTSVTVTTAGVTDVNLNNVTGSVNLGTGSMAGQFAVTGGSVSTTYSGNLSQTANAAMVNVSGGHSGTLTFQTGTLDAINGSGLQFDNADGTYNFNGTTNLHGGDAGVDIVNGSGGAFNFGANTSITNPTGVAFNVNGGAGNIDYNGTISKTSDGQTIAVQNHTGGTVSFDGAVSSTSSSDGINLATNTGATINFTGALTLNTSSSGTTAFNATGGGTVTATGSGSTINSGTGTALNIANTTIGASDVTFQSISSSGGSANGIILNTTGTAGGLHVTGTAGAGSGGTIANKSGIDANFATQGTGIYLNNTSDVQLNHMQLNDFSNFGIRGDNVTNFKFDNSVISGVSGDNTGASDEAAIRFGGTLDTDATGLLGTASISNDTISGGWEYNIKLLNNSGTLDRLIVDNTDIGANHDSSSGNGGDSFQIVTNNSATANVTFTNGSLTSAGADLFDAVAHEQSNLDVVFSNNTVSNNHVNQAGAASNVLVASSSTGNVTYDIENNTITADTTSAIANTSNGIAVAKGIPDTGSGGTMSGIVNHNTIGISNVAGSGSAFTGIFASSLGTGTHTTAITNNTIYHYNEEGIFLKANDNIGGGTSVLNATVTGNLVTNPDSLAFAGLWVLAGSGSGTESQVINLTLGDVSTAAVVGSPTGSLQNDFTNGDPANASDVEIQELGSGTVINLSKAGSASGTTALVVQDDNVGTPVVDSFGTINFTTAQTVRLIATPATVYEDGSQNITYTFLRYGDTTSALTVNFTVGGTAVFNTDYTAAGAATFGASSGTVTFAAHTDLVQVTIDPSVDATVESNDTVTLTLAAGGGYTAASPSAATATIINDDVPLMAAPGGIESENSIPPVDSTPTPDTTAAPSDTPAPDATPSEPIPVHSDPAPPPPSAPGTVETQLTQAELDGIVDAAIARWEATGLTVQQSAYLHSVTLSVADMSGLYLGGATPGHIAIDTDAAGYGWYLDATPAEDSEFGNALAATRLQTDPSQLPAGRIDLLSTVMHELGHQLGLADSYALGDQASLMYGYLVTGERRLPGDHQADGATPGSIDHEEFAVGPVAIGTLPAGRTVTITFDATVDAQSNGLIANPTNTGTVTSSFASVNTNANVITLDSLALGNLVFHDTNGNGIYEPADLETGIDGVALTLFLDSNHNGVLDIGTDTQLATTTTAGGGLYSFIGLAPNLPAPDYGYIVRVDAGNFGAGQPLNGLTRTTGVTNPNGNADNDSNGVAASGGATASNALTLTYNSEPAVGVGNDTNDTLDFGFSTAPPNAAPVVDLNGAGGGTGATLNYTENQAATSIAPAATIADATSSDFDGGTLTIAFTANGTVDDQLTIQNQGTGAGQIGVSGGNVTFGGATIGTFVGGNSGNSLVVTFNSNATPAAAQALAGAILYANFSNNPSILPRTVTFTLVDGDGGSDTGSAIATINVAAVNDAPTDITGVLAVNEFAANGSAVGTVSALDSDSASFTWSFAAGGDAGGRFAIDSTTGAITVANGLLLDFEQNASHNVTLHVVDNLGAPIATDKVLAVAVNNVDPETVVGDGNPNTFVGGALADQLSGLGGSDTLDGGGGDDTLTGGPGADTLIGGNGTDTASYASSAAGVTVNLATNVHSGGDAAGDSLTGIENLTGSAQADTLTGDSGNNRLDGGAGADVLIGGAGHDAYIVDNAGDTVTENPGEGTDIIHASVTTILGPNLEHLILTGSAAIDGTGNSLDNAITGNSNDNVLDGFSGEDILFGGGGIDRLTGNSAGDQLYGGTGDDIYTVHHSGAGAFENAGEGTDIVFADVSYILGSNIENLVLIGLNAINGTGNNLDNIINGNVNDNVIDGGAGQDTLSGGGGGDTLTGNSAGDQLYGGIGNDSYIVHHSGAGAFENAGEGTDTVNADVSYILGSHVEMLNLTGLDAINGTGNSLDNAITGNLNDNVLDGGSGEDTLFGGGSNDVLIGNSAGDQLYGSTGNDFYIVHHSGAGAFENAGQGTDWVFADVSYAIGSHVEHLTLTGNAAINGTGNNLDNAVTGNSNSNTLDGDSGEDVLFGAGGDDTLIGNSAGDQLYGSADNDTYIVHNSSAGAFENAGAGTDTVLADVSYILGSHVENITLTGAAAIDATGNNLDNAITGNAAANMLTGNGGADTFVFAAAGTGHDTVTDFDAANASAGHDLIDFQGHGLNFAALTINQVGADTQILIGADEITLKNVLTANIDAGDFLF